MPSSRLLIGIAITLGVFSTLNFITIRTLLLAHPGKRPVIWIATLIGNLMWLLLPLLFTARTTTPVRILRAVLGPPWFSWALFIILYSAITTLLAITWLIFARTRMSFGSFAHIPSSVFLITLGILTLIGIYQALVPLRVERVPVRILNLPAELRGYRIAVISDLHVGLFSRLSRLRTISRAVNRLDPNLLAISGDMIDDDPYFIPKFLRGLEPIHPRTKMLAVLGNHEIYGDPHGVIRALEGSRVELLVNRGTLLRNGSGSIWIAGLSDYAAGSLGRAAELRPDFERALQGAPRDATVIALSHQPRAFAEAREWDIPLTICGHTHGGQCGIRPLGWSVAGLFLPYDMGLYERDGCQLYVNTGTGYWVLPFRLGMTPEITLIELTSGTLSG